ncbi:MAG: DNA translocase SpoIIIE [Elusimicrobia bacterium ADurb.Bin231]|nr:MAG: DNA translocase SpoIIIE [Elusimicrobia bacterium ADurb.Bin231]
MKRKDIRGLILVFLGILFAWFLIFPTHSGWLGSNIQTGFRIVFGKVVSYFFPVILFWKGIKFITHKKIRLTDGHPNKQKNDSGILSAGLFIWSLCCIFYLISPAGNLGGYVGKYSADGIAKIVGTFGVWTISLCVFLVAGFITTGIPISTVVNAVIEILKPKRNKTLDSPEPALYTKPKVNIPVRAVIKHPEPPKISELEKHIPISHIKQSVKPAINEKVKDSVSGQEPRRADKTVSQAEYILPSINLLDEPKTLKAETVEKDLRDCAEKLIATLESFNISASVDSINPGPVITRYDIVPAPGIKVSSILNLSNDISLAMKTSSIRVLAPIPGKSAVGIEIPNPNPATVSLKEILNTRDFVEAKSLLTFAFGKTVPGEPFCDNLVSMPHLLIAGTTGSGKSICLHSIIMSIIMKAKPDEVKFLMIDPKQLELPVYNDLPHLIDPIIKDSQMAVESLKALVKIMEERYKTFAGEIVRNIDGFNISMAKKGKPKMPYIVVIIDELADLMLVTKNEVEESIRRLSQMARAVGIHLILATQRPSVDVITGVIKANLPSRISLQVLSKTDSRVIIDTNGAEDLIGKGDMLYLHARYPKPIRLQGCYVSEGEIERVVNFIKKQRTPEYQNIITRTEAREKKEISQKEKDELITALKFTFGRRRISYDLLKTNGFGNKAADILSRLEMEGFISKPEGTNRWTIYFDKIENFINETEKI